MISDSPVYQDFSPGQFSLQWIIHIHDIAIVGVINALVLPQGLSDFSATSAGNVSSLITDSSV